MILKILKNNKGFSLLELVVALAIFGIIIVTISNIVVLNVRIASINKARTRAREETGFVLTQIKRDVRNASKAKILNSQIDPIGCATKPDMLIVETDPQAGSTTGRIYLWTTEGTQIAKYNYTGTTIFENINCTTDLANKTLITRMPIDIKVNRWSVILPKSNTLITTSPNEVAQITIIIEASMDLPIGSIFENSINIKKQTIIATRNFIVQQY